MASTVDFLKVASAFEEETNYTVWLDLHSNLQQISVILQNTDFHDKYQLFLKNLFSKIYAKLGWDQKSGESTYPLLSFSSICLALSLPHPALAVIILSFEKNHWRVASKKQHIISTFDF